MSFSDSRLTDVPERSKFESRLLSGGDEPDPRFTLANERTFLAWTRTALAFLAGGIALEAFPPETFAEELRTPVALLIIVIGLLIAAGSAVRWIRVERAMRHSRPLPLPGIVPLLSLGLVAAIAVIIGVFL
ncbi:YidH family protein [Corynebacterium halotolerans]|uniref:YidH family protein n=1 Tax=Corynebacterium halotolerans TaxID=225326 RepID=UPI003CF43243